MPSAGILIVLTVLGTWGCVKARAAGPAAAGAALAVLCIVATPLGSWLPTGLSSLFSVLDGVTTPVLNHDSGGGEPAPVNSSGRPGTKTVGVDR
jgi:hypothetical protein